MRGFQNWEKRFFSVTFSQKELHILLFYKNTSIVRYNYIYYLVPRPLGVFSYIPSVILDLILSSIKTQMDFVDL